DGDFTDADENVYASIGTFITPHITSGFTPPAGALLGNTRMRIRLHDAGIGPNATPCGNSDYGEVEDYSVNVISNVCVPVNITNHPAALQSSCSPSASISFNVTATGDSPINYQWQYNNGGNWVNVSNGIPTGAIYTNTSSNAMTVNGITNASTYEYRCYLSNCNGINFQTSNNALLVINPNPSNAGTISGLTTVCQNQNNVIYTVPTITNATSYIWTLPAGANGSSTTNTITVNFGSNAVSGNIIVNGSNACGYGTFSSKSITVNTLPTNAGIISGATTVCKGQNNVIYSVATIANATSYIWTLPVGASGNSTTNSISANFSNNATSGNITIKGSNTCGESNTSSLSITVKAIPDMASGITGEDSVNQGQGNIAYTVPLIANASTYSWTLPANVSGNSSNNSINLYFSDSSLSGNLTVKGQNECGIGEPSSIYIKVFKQLNVTLFLEGIYQPLAMTMAKVQDENGDHFSGNISDTLNVSLHSNASPYQLLHSFANINLLQNGWCSFRIPSEINQAYYMAIRHRNHIETWSSFPVSFANDTVTYDFTNAIDKAYGDNQKQVSPGKFAILVGDVNQDGVIDLSDLVNMDSDITNGSLGYIVYDLNGDGIIDLSDLVKIDENLTNGIVVITP
ncbi:MAG: GEVED domain-containing protein, partial [Ferruginibacter sp.]